MHILLCDRTDKLRSLGICSPPIDWITDFLFGRVMTVSNIRSSFMDVRSGVQRGACFFRCYFFFLLTIYLPLLFLNVSFLLMI